MTIPDIPWLPSSPQTPREYDSWKLRVLEHRLNVLHETQHNEGARAREIARSSQSFPYLANTYGAIYEARREDEFFDPTIDLEDEIRSVIIPYVMYPFQIEVAYWLDDRLKHRGNQGDGFILKSRDMGMSNEVAFWLAWNWMYRVPFQGRILSYRERQVDKVGDSDSIFWKIDTFLMALPPWLFYSSVPNFDWKSNRTLLTLINPSNKNALIGESTQINAGRSGRATVYLLDEGCVAENLDEIYSGIRASTNHRIIVSTANTEKGMTCHDIAEGDGDYVGKQPAIFKIEWDQHPEHTDEWFDEEQERDDPEKFAREVLMDWYAGQGGHVYPEVKDYEPGDFPYIPFAGDFVVAIDDGWDDDWAMVFLQYLPQIGRIHVLDSYSASHKPVDYYGSILNSKPSSQFDYDDEAKRIMEWLRNIPRQRYYVGDKHGNNTQTITGKSAYDHLWMEHNIPVMYWGQGQEKVEKLSFRDKRTQTGKILTHTDFHDEPGAQFVLRAFRNHKFKVQEEGKEHIRENREPLHSKWSHVVNAFEYFSAQFDIFRLSAGGSGAIVYAGQRNKG